MTTDEQYAFLAAIVASPDDDLPRLVYADWLDERGQADRAAFIRVQCELARWTDPKKCPACGEVYDFSIEPDGHAEGGGLKPSAELGCPNDHFWKFGDIDALKLREPELIRSTDPEMWSLYYKACWPPSRFTFRRGFLDTVRCETGDWIGEPCPNCHERGLADPETGLVECGRCECTGEIGRMGPTILSDFPTVRRVELDDAEPAGDDDGGCYWFDESMNRTGFRNHHHLPVVLYKLLQGGRVNGNVTLYDTREAAETALSDACIRFAKEDVH